MSELPAEDVAPGSRYVRFATYTVSRDAEMVLGPKDVVMSARYVHDGTQWPGRWHVVVATYEERHIDGSVCGSAGALDPTGSHAEEV